MNVTLYCGAALVDAESYVTWTLPAPIVERLRSAVWMSVACVAVLAFMAMAEVVCPP